MAAAVGVAAAFTTTIAVAAWMAVTAPGGAGRSRAATMPAGNQPTATVNAPPGSTVEVTWSPSTGGVPVGGYEVRSYDAATGTPRTVGAACAGLVTGTSCTETGVPDGTWRYSVVPRYEQWRGAESPLGDPVVVDTSYRGLVLSDGPGGYWRLGESSGSTAVDETGASDGTYAGGYTLGASGALANDPNTAVELDGAGGRVGVPSVPAINFDTRVTIEAWVNPDSLAGTRWIVNKGTYYFLYIDKGTTYFGVNAGGPYLFVTTTTVTTGSWQHLVGTYDGSKLVLYRNGVEVAQAPATGPISTTTVPLYIGAFDGTGSFFDGRIDEVAVYGTALTSTEVLSHYQRGNGTRPATTVTFPAFGGAYSDASWNGGCSTPSAGDICGTAVDTGGGVASVAVSVRQGSGNYWDGTSFSSPTEVLLPATGTTSWSLAFPATNLPVEGSYAVRAVAVDGSGNAGTARATFTIDRTSPSVSTTFPAAGGLYSISSWNAGCSTAGGDVCGTAADSGSSVASVAVSVRQGAGNYWNGTSFSSPTEVLLPATGTTSWTFGFPGANFPSNGSYTVRAVATDAAGNTASTSRTFTIDRTAPTVGVTFPTAGAVYSAASWDAGCSTAGGDVCGTAADTGSSVASVAVSVRQGAGNYWNGTSFSSATEVLHPATGTTSWSLAFPATTFPADGSYTIRTVATDAAGNTGTTSRTFTIDRTGPAPTAVTLVNANGVVTPETDEVRITFSEPLDVSSVCSAWSGTGDQALGGSGVVVTITDNLVNDTLTVSAGACTLHVGTVATGGDYVLSTSMFSGSTAATESRVTWTAATRVLTIHLGSHTSGLLNSLIPQAAGTVTYTPDAAIKDPVGNGVATAPFSATGQRF
jgi:hypothetical protein